MSTRVLHIPAKSLSEARMVAHAVEAGRVPCLKQYLDEARAKASAVSLTELHRVPYTVIPIIMVDGLTDDGRIKVARVANTAGQAVAALLLVIGGPFLVGLVSLL